MKTFLACIGLVTVISLLVIGWFLIGTYAGQVRSEGLPENFKVQWIEKVPETVVAQIERMIDATYPQKDPQLAYFKPQKTDRWIYVREYPDFKPPRGAPIFYAPFPDTLCMLGGSHDRDIPRIIYEAQPGVCDKLIWTYSNGQD